MQTAINHIITMLSNETGRPFRFAMRNEALTTSRLLRQNLFHYRRHVAARHNGSDKNTDH